MKSFLTVLGICAVLISSNVALSRAQTPSPSPSAAATATIAVVTIQNYAYAPATLTIHAGQTVRFDNKDDVAHTVTDKGGSFDSGSIDTGKSWTHTFSKTGTFAYYCSVHPSMTGTIVVTSP